MKMSPHAHGNISLTDSDRFGSASSFDPLDCSSLHGRTVAVRHLQRLNAQKNSGLNSGCSLTSRSCGSRRKSFDDYDAEYLRRSLQSDDLISALTLADDLMSALTPPPPPPPGPATRELLSTLRTPPPPPPSRSPNRLSKSAQENVERYKQLYDAELQDVLKALKADDPTADISLSDHGACPTIAPRNYDDNSYYEVLERITEPTAVEKGFDPPPSMSDDFQPPAITMMPSEDSLSDCSTVVIDCDNESHDVMSLLSDSNDGLTMESFPPANKMRSSATNEKRRPRKDHAKGKKRRPKSGGDRGRQGGPSSTSRTKKRSDDEEKKSENIVQRGRQSSRSKSPFAIYVRGRSPSPAGNDDRDPTQTVSKPYESPYNKLRSKGPFHRSSSTGQQDAAGADVPPNKSLSREKPGHPPSTAGLSSNDVNHSDEKKKAKLMKKMKTIASGLKHRLGESKKLLSSGSASHVFKGGDVAEYRLGSRVCLEDLEYFIGEDGYTKMCAVRILEVAEDAVYGHPLYTILLPNGSKRQTNGNFLTPPCAKQKTTESYRSRHQSAMKLKSCNRSSARTSSKHHSRSRSVESNSSRRSNRSTSSHRSSSSHRSTSSHRSSSSHRSTSSHRSSSHRHPRQSPSKSRQINYHRYGSNDRSSPRSKQRKHTSSTNENVHISCNRDFDESKTQRW